MDSRFRGKDSDMFVMRFVILAKAGIHACSGKTPLEEMDSRIRGKDSDMFVKKWIPAFAGKTMACLSCALSSSRKRGSMLAVEKRH